MSEFSKSPLQASEIRKALNPFLGAASALVLLAFCAHGWGQITNVTNDQSVATPGIGHNYLGGLSDIVNPGNGSVSLRLPVQTPPGRGLSLPFQFGYNSNGIIQMQEGGNNVFPVSNLDVGFLEQGGWTYGTPTITSSSIQVPGNNSYGLSCPVYTSYLFTAPDGSRHPMGLALANWQTCQSVNANYSVIDQSGDGIYSAWTANDGKTSTADPLSRTYWLTDYSGTLYHFASLASGAACSTCNGPDYIEDRNGNQIKFAQGSTSSVTPFTETDTTGRTLLSVATFGSTSGDQVSLSEYPHPFVVSWKSTPYNFGLPVTTTGITNNAAGCGTGPFVQGSISGSENVVSSIELPNGTSYTFQYDSTYGLLNKLTYPNGAYVSYTWSTSNQPSDAIYYPGNTTTPTSCAAKYSAPVILHRYVSYDGTTVAEQQDFTYATTWNAGTAVWTSKQTTVKTTDLLTSNSPNYTTTYVYTPMPIAEPPNIHSAVANQVPVESSITYSDYTGSVLQVVSKAWKDSNQLAAECTTTPSTGQTSAIFYGYAGELLISDKAEYDYGTVSSSCQKPSSGSPARETITAYHAFGTTPINSYILNAPDSVKTYSAGVLLAQTNYTYDQGSVATASATNHDGTINYPSGTPGVRGNATTVTRLCFQPNGTACTSSATQTVFDETGQPITVTDANSNLTTYSYTDSYTGDNGSPAANTNAFVTIITRNPTNGFSHVQTFQYGFNDGKLRSSVDENGQKTSYCYWTSGCSGSSFDPWMRLTQTVNPDTGGQIVAYSDTGASPTVTTKVVASPDPNVVTETTMNALGWPVMSQLISDPGGVTTTKTTYNGVGQIASASNPYRSTSDPTYGATTYGYDALGRMILQTEPDGYKKSWTFNGGSVVLTDENGHVWTRTSDGLGRLIGVSEPGGLQTSYTYDALNNLLSVNQMGTGSDTQRARSFTYDSFSRLLSASSPETGLICYGVSSAGGCNNSANYYDPVGNIKGKTDARGVTTTYSYDALNRVLSKSYSNGSPSTCYQYDASGGNRSGRLVSEWTQAGSCPASAASGVVSLRTVLTYDAMGRIKSEQQCTPGNSCTVSSGPQLSYGYDAVGNPTSLANSVGAAGNQLTITTGFDAAGHMNSVTSNWTAYPTAIYSLPTNGYGPVGPLNWNLGSNLSLAENYTKRLWVNRITATGQVP